MKLPPKRALLLRHPAAAFNERSYKLAILLGLRDGPGEVATDQPFELRDGPYQTSLRESIEVRHSQRELLLRTVVKYTTLVSRATCNTQHATRDTRQPSLVLV